MQQLNKNSKNPAIQYSVSIPELSNYLDAAKLCVPAVVQAKIGPENLVNPLVYFRVERESATHIHKAYSTMDLSAGSKTAADYVMEEWVKANSISPTCPPNSRVLNLLDGPAEVVKTPDNPEYMTVLGGDYYLGIVDPNGIQMNTLFYERLLYKEQSYSFVGFRILVTTAIKF